VYVGKVELEEKEISVGLEELRPGHLGNIPDWSGGFEQIII
jgi:hypothetical protein